MENLRHEPGRPGSVDAITLPVPSTPMHSEREGQVRLSSVLSAVTRRQEDAPRSGCPDMSTLPRTSKATHNDAEGHDTDLSCAVPSMCLTFHVAAPSVG